VQPRKLGKAIHTVAILVEEGSFRRIQKLKQRDRIVGYSLEMLKNLSEKAKKDRLDN
jgi:hypothetical protein